MLKVLCINFLRFNGFIVALFTTFFCLPLSFFFLITASEDKNIIQNIQALCGLKLRHVVINIKFVCASNSLKKVRGVYVILPRGE